VNRAKELKRQAGLFWNPMPMTCRYFSFLRERAGNPAAFRQFANGNFPTVPTAPKLTEGGPTFNR
jgi:hypothetical protein